MRQLDVAVGEVCQDISDRVDVAVDALDRIDLVFAQDVSGNVALGGSLERLCNAIAKGIDRRAPCSRTFVGIIGVNGDEQVRLVSLCKACPFVEGDERVVAAGHHDLISPGLLQQVAKDKSEGENDVLFDRTVLLRAGIIAAVAGIEHDDRLERPRRPFLRALRKPRQRRLNADRAKPRRCGYALGVTFQRCARREDRERKPISTLFVFDDVRFSDDDRLRDADHDAHFARCREARPHALDEAYGRVAVELRKADVNLRQFDDDTVRMRK